MILGSLAAVLVGCVSPGPVLTPDTPIPVRVAVRSLVNATPAFETSLPRSSKLTESLTDVLVRDFREATLFAVVERDLDQPDLVLTGSVQRFVGRWKPNALQVLLLILTNQGYQTAKGAVELELLLERADGERVASYRASAESSRWTSSDTGEQAAVRAQLDAALSRALVDLGSQIRADRDKLSSLARSSALP